MDVIILIVIVGREVDYIVFIFFVDSVGDIFGVFLFFDFFFEV